MKFLFSVLLLFFVGYVLYKRKKSFDAYKKRIIGLNKNNQARYRYK